MRETEFIDQNKKKWAELEDLLKKDYKNPDQLSELFVQITDDLSYARTFYKNRSVRVYLNGLAQRIFQNIYKNKKENKNNFIRFWKEELPYHLFKARKEILLSFIIFVFSVTIGVFSTRYDYNFPKIILGESYVTQTLENIKKGDPMAVYKGENALEMFFAIAYNNLRVAFFSFVLGVFYTLGTIFFVLYNGVMVGSFQYFFFREGVYMASIFTIWLHGTLEMSAMIIGAAAGITMGKGILFPGTYSRSQSFLIHSRRGFKIFIGILPVIVFAAFIESFMTRYTEIPNVLRGGVILLSLLLIIGYYIWYPYLKNHKSTTFYEKPLPLRSPLNRDINLAEVKSNGEILKDVFNFYKLHFFKFMKMAFIAAIICTIIALAGNLHSRTHSFTYKNYFFFTQLLDIGKSIPLFISFNLMFTITFTGVNYYFNKYVHLNEQTFNPITIKASILFVKTVLISSIISGIFLISPLLTIWIFIITAPAIFIWMYSTTIKNVFHNADNTNWIQVYYTMPSKVYGLFSVLFLLFILYFFMVDSPLLYFYFEILNWNLNLSSETMNKIVLTLLVFTCYFGFALILPILISGINLLYFSLIEIKTANGLMSEISTITEKIEKGK